MAAMAKKQQLEDTAKKKALYEEQKKQEEETTAEVKLQAATQILLEHARGLVTAEAAGKPGNEDTLSEVSESIPTDETIPTEASENNKSV